MSWITSAALGIGEDDPASARLPTVDFNRFGESPMLEQDGRIRRRYIV